MKSTYNKYVKYNTSLSGICCTMITYDIFEGKYIRNVIFYEGCPAGLKALAKAIDGKEINEVIKMFDGMECGNRDSSCPNELAKSLKEELEIIKNNSELNLTADKILLNGYENFLEKSKINTDKYKIILRIKPEAMAEVKEEISKFIESERDIYWFKFKDVEILEDSSIKDDFIFNSELKDEIN